MSVPTYNPHKVLMVDIDDTLVHEEESHGSESIGFDYHGRTITLWTNTRNVATVRRFKRLGYQIVFWSRTGYDWAKIVTSTIGLSDSQDTFLTKPLFYLDDRDCQDWMGERIWKEPT